MTDEIEPALSPEEWEDDLRELHKPRMGGTTMDAPEVNNVRISHGSLVVEWYGGWGQGAIPVSDTMLPILIALANAALPDHDPRKITPRGLDAIENIMDEYGVGTEENKIAHHAMNGLRALLPPLP